MSLTKNKPAKIHVIGIGADGWDGLSLHAQHILQNSDMIYGGERHLRFLPSTIRSEKQKKWLSPFKENFTELKSLTNQNISILATGDPLTYGIGSSLLRIFDRQHIEFIPHLSAFTLAAARMGWSLSHHNTKCLTIHGRPIENIFLHLHHDAQIILLAANKYSLGEVATYLTKNNFGQSHITVLSEMGGPKESKIELIAKQYDSELPEDLNVICIKCINSNPENEQSLCAGLPDDIFIHDGKITKQEIRAATLAALAPKHGELLWDVGAGSGSISIEWIRLGGQAIAIENQQKRLEMLAQNAANLGIPTLDIQHGKAPEILANLPKPSAIFIGGGLTSENLIENCWAALPVHGRLVANAVTIEGERILSSFWSQYGGEMKRISVERLVKVGPHHGWKPFMPVTQFRIVKK